MSDDRRYAITLRFTLADDEKARERFKAVIATFREQDALVDAELLAEAAPHWTRVDVLERGVA